LVKKNDAPNRSWLAKEKRKMFIRFIHDLEQGNVQVNEGRSPMIDLNITDEAFLPTKTMEPVTQTNNRERTIMLAVFIPIISILILFIVLCCLWNRYCKSIT
jgi:hypothetical protein